MRKTTAYLLFFFLVVGLAIFGYVAERGDLNLSDNHQNEHNINIAEAATESNYLSGYAWSDNVGWISFDCSNTNSCGSVNYGVNVHLGGELSGYAWSDNMGWITFNDGELNGCPAGECRARIEGGALKGWARALAGTDANDGWDGWISLSDHDTTAYDYGISLNADNTLGGFAWGSTVVGWMNFNTAYSEVRIETTDPTANIQVSPSTIESGQRSTINWSSQDADQCVGICSGDSNCSFSTGGATSGSTQTIELSSNTTYSISCSNGLGGVCERVGSSKCYAT